MMRCMLVSVICLLSAGHVAGTETADRNQALESFLKGQFRWRLSPPLLAPEEGREDHCYSVKDFSVVFYNGRWHVFHTTRSAIRSHRVEYVSFRRWEEANASKRHVLRCTGDGYIAAPQVFYFRPQKKWYLIYQAVDQSRKPALQPAYSTTDNIEDPNSWTPARMLFSEHPRNVTRWIDFWVICDEPRAHLFFSSLDGRFWRSSTDLKDFPGGFGPCEVVLNADEPGWRLHEASCTYKLKGMDKYLTIIECIRKAPPSGRRFFVAYLADRLDGEWKPLAASLEEPFASADNVTHPDSRWTDNISHGELIRDGYDETLTVDPANLRFVIQGALDEEIAGKKYGEIPWRLGVLTHTDLK
jgi:hypothetical protein